MRSLVHPQQRAACSRQPRSGSERALVSGSIQATACRRTRRATVAVRAVAAGAPPPADDSGRVSTSAAAAAAAPTAAQTAAPPPPPLVAVPRSIHDVDNGKILGFGADLAPDHPGFGDEAYKRRRVWIADLARQHEIGDPIPRIDYTADEVAVWATALRELTRLFPSTACREYLRTLPLLGFREDAIPQLQDVSDALAAASGWRIRPVAGLMHPRDFLAGLAFKHFHSTQYVRHASQPMYTPEPDVVHELIGHVPMLADPDFSAMAQAIGIASLGADEKTIWHLTKCYWYTVEFGVVREGSAIKAFGAGILSSYGELAHLAAGADAAIAAAAARGSATTTTTTTSSSSSSAANGDASTSSSSDAARAAPPYELLPFDPYAPQPRMSYKDGFQRRYFVLNSFAEGARLLQDYARALALPEGLRGNPSRA